MKVCPISDRQYLLGVCGRIFKELDAAPKARERFGRRPRKAGRNEKITFPPEWKPWAQSPAPRDLNLWVSVREGLPRMGETVLVCHYPKGGAMTRTGCLDESGVWRTEAGERIGSVLFWMRFPPPPLGIW